MSDLSLIQYVLIALIFIWSGFVRSGLGFGGAVLSLPFLLLVKDDPLVFLPIIAVHLLVFSSLTIWTNNRRSYNSKAGKSSQKLTGFGPDVAAKAPESTAGAEADWRVWLVYAASKCTECDYFCDCCDLLGVVHH